MTDPTPLDQLREEYNAARGRLAAAVVEACPGPHQPTQHRDRLPPWCPVCGRDSLGRRWKRP